MSKLIKKGANKAVNVTLTQGTKVIKLSPEISNYVKNTLKKYTNSDYERKYVLEKHNFEAFARYQSWLNKNKINKKDIEKIENEINKFKIKPKFSILLPIYKTPPDLLVECIESVVNQYYDNWEICLVDDFSEDNKLKTICQKYKKAIPDQFKYKYRKNNGHISTASNDAAELATGDYLVLLDHDDVLWPNALYEVALAINSKGKADLFYTDEDMIDINGNQAHPYVKPDFTQSLLDGCNYITHMAVIDRNIFDKIGGFRKGVEGAQDWDLLLRITEVTKNIQHIPKILYSWRMIEDSTALKGFDAKPYAYDAQKRLLLITKNRLACLSKTPICITVLLGGWPNIN
jgi:glycosyltransferase involved in cell wall biosynthesis